MTTKTVLTSRIWLPALILSVAWLLPAASAAQPVGTAFTYQGQLINGGTAQNGPCDFRFKLFTAASGGSQIGSTQTLTGVSVSNGLYGLPGLTLTAGAAGRLIVRAPLRRQRG